MTNTPNPLASDWRERLANAWYRLKLGDTALQIEKDGRRQRATEFAVVQAYKAAGLEGKHPLEDEEVAVSVGDTTINHYTPPTASGSSSTLKTAGLVGAGALAALAAPIAYDAITSRPTPDPSQAAVSQDRDTQYQFRVVPELSGDRDP